MHTLLHVLFIAFEILAALGVLAVIVVTVLALFLTSGDGNPFQ